MGCWLGVLLGWPDNEEDGARLAQAAESLTKAIKSEAGTTDVHPQLVKVWSGYRHLREWKYVGQVEDIQMLVGGAKQSCGRAAK